MALGPLGRRGFGLERLPCVSPAIGESAIYEEWASDVHGHSGVQCIDCHGDVGAGANEGVAASAAVWRERMDHEGCRGCHEREVEGWLKGKHGVRLALELDSMTPGLARREMDAAAGHRSLSCVSCHGAHQFDTAYAAVDACLTCHQDEHSRNYLGSAHHQSWQEQQTSAGSQALGVSCATCHMPRIVETAGGEEQVRVEHNQNRYLQPNEGMIRTVCLHLERYSWVPAVRALGKRHVGYGVRDEHYDTVGTALLWTLEQGLGDHFTTDVYEAWAEVYTTLASVMKEAARDGVEASVVP